MEILTHLGLDTGYTPENLSSFKSSLAQAGLEKRLYHANAPYVVKQPEINDSLPELLRENRVIIDHAFIPIRHLKAAADSRRRVSRIGYQQRGLYGKLKYLLGIDRHVNGGLMSDMRHLQRSINQEEILSMRFYDTLLTLSRYSIPITLLHYPTLVQQKAYLYEKLLPLVGHIDREQFDQVVDGVIDLSLMHSFTPEDRPLASE